MLKRREERKLLRKDGSCYDDVEGDEESKVGGCWGNQHREEGKSQIIRNGVLEHTYLLIHLEIGSCDSSPLGAETMASITIAPPIH